jgi:hypothetical protein
MEQFNQHIEKDMVTASLVEPQDVAAALAYTAPHLVVIGTTVALVQGPQWQGKYKDYGNSGWNNSYSGAF